MKLFDNPLQHVVLGLVDIFETDSKQSQQLEKDKMKQTITVPSTVSALDQQSSTPTVRPSTPDHPFPTSYETPDHKRKLSETSFGTRSTDSTPTKLDQPEAKVQSLQDKFIAAIVTNVWIGGKIDLSWVQGRHMFLTYAEYHPRDHTDTRTNKTSFKYMRRLPDGRTLEGRVRAVADGALRLKTNKSTDPSKYCLWSKQRCALSFEVDSQSLLTTGKESKH
jgi:hypothetical protein